jgi:hypothetical protein
MQLMCGWLQLISHASSSCAILHQLLVLYRLSLTDPAGSPGTSAPAVPFCGCPIDGSLVRQSVGHCQLNPIGRSAVFGGMRM